MGRTPIQIPMSPLPGYTQIFLDGGYRIPGHADHKENQSNQDPLSPRWVKVDAECYLKPYCQCERRNQSRQVHVVSICGFCDSSRRPALASNDDPWRRIARCFFRGGTSASLKNADCRSPSFGLAVLFGEGPFSSQRFF